MRQGWPQCSAAAGQYRDIRGRPPSDELQRHFQAKPGGSDERAGEVIIYDIKVGISSFNLAHLPVDLAEHSLDYVLPREGPSLLTGDYLQPQPPLAYVLRLEPVQHSQSQLRLVLQQELVEVAPCVAMHRSELYSLFEPLLGLVELLLLPEYLRH